MRFPQSPERGVHRAMADRGAEDKDYYRILGVQQTASPATIAAAYYVLARQYHPDLHGNNPAMVAKFKLINEAYEVLSDEEKRRDYDRRRRQRSRSPTQRPARRGRGTVAEVLQPMFARSSRRSRMVRRPNDVEVELPVTPEEARLGAPCEFILRIPQPCPDCEGRGAEGNCACHRCGGTGTWRTRQRLCIGLPRHVSDGTVLRFAGQGKAGSGRWPVGDLYVRIRIRPCW